MSESNGIFTAVGQGLDYMINDLIIGGLDRAIRGASTAISNLASGLRGGDETSSPSRSTPMESAGREIAASVTPPITPVRAPVVEPQKDMASIMASISPATQEMVQAAGRELYAATGPAVGYVIDGLASLGGRTAQAISATAPIGIAQGAGR